MIKNLRNWVATDVWFVVTKQTLHFVKHFNCENFGKVLLKGLEATIVHILPLIDVMGARLVVVFLDSRTLSHCGYTYIHEMGYRKAKRWLELIINLELFVKHWPNICLVDKWSERWH